MKKYITSFSQFSFLSLLFFMFLISHPANAATVTVNPGESIQEAINNASSGDRIEVNSGVYNENLDLQGKNIQIVGLGPDVVVRGTGGGPVITINKGENFDTLIERLVIEGGSSDENGGGILVVNSCPVMNYLTVKDNFALKRGSGIYFEGINLESCDDGSVVRGPFLSNSIIARNKNINLAVEEAHAIDIINSGPGILNCTIIDNDSNGVFINGDSDPQLFGNIIAFNGSETPRTVGRGICFVGANSNAQIFVEHNLLRRNVRGAFHVEGKDFNGVRRAQRFIRRERPSWSARKNKGGNPRFVDRENLNLRLRKRSAARNAGLDGTDMGITGGSEPHPDYL